MAPLTEFVIGTKMLLNGFRARQQPPPFVIPAEAGIQEEEWVPPVFIPLCAGGSRHERLVGRHVPDPDPGQTVPATSSEPRRTCNAGACRPPPAGRHVVFGTKMVLRGLKYA